LASALSLRAHDPITTKVTWSKEVVRIFDNHCIACHAKDASGPFPLSTYDEAKPWAKAIRDEVVTRHMPPWPAARGFGHFSNDPTLSPFEIELVAAWVDGGAPKGDEKDLPRVVSPTALSKSNNTFALPRRTASPSGQTRAATVTPGFAGDRWIAGWQFVPNDPAIVAAELSVDDGAGSIGAWVPSAGAVRFPENAAQRLRQGQSIGVTVRYRTARQQQDFPVDLPSAAPELRLIFAERPPSFEIEHATIGCNQVTSLDKKQDLLPRELPVDSKTLLGLRVAGAANGARVGVEAAGVPLLWIAHSDTTYEPTYWLGHQTQAGFPLKTVSDDRASGCRVDVDYERPVQR